MKNSKKSLGKWFAGHIRKIALLGINFVFNHDLVFRFFGWLGVFKTVFVAYPAYEKLALAYVYPSHRHWMRWNPWPAGIFRQNGAWGLMLVISSTEKEFLSSDNTEDMLSLIQRTDEIRSLLRADQMTFAGILPGVFAARGLREDSPESGVTAEAVMKAEEQVNPDQYPVVVLGGKGFIGRRLVRKMKSCGREVYCVDLDQDSTWPSHLEGKPVVVINVTKKAALADYIPRFWPGVILLNEVYPAPNEEEVSAMEEKGIKAFHVVGLEAFSLPSFPREYHGGIPCCAGWLSSGMKVITRELATA